MKLIYYQRNNNFGDALNPLILEHFLPDFFNEDLSSVFLGIGSIIHFKVPQARHTVIFSSGYAYGKMPVFDSSYNIACVRGKLTAEKLKLNKRLVITDGAALIKDFIKSSVKKEFPFSFMPHHESVAFFNWKKVCEEVGYHYIDPLDNTDNIIASILKSEIIIAEAMHGAIVADALRVPWIPVKLYPTINEFKWHDWTSSLDMKYAPQRIKSLYNYPSIATKVGNRITNRNFRFMIPPTAESYKLFQDLLFKGPTIKEFFNLRNSRPFLSNGTLLNSKVIQLRETLHSLQQFYRLVHV